jgi:hypothetical protein
MRLVYAFAVLLTSCAADVQVPLGPRAAFDLNCPPDQLRYTDLGNDAWGARCDDRRATYRWSCNVSEIDTNPAGRVKSKGKCDWVRN